MATLKLICFISGIVLLILFWQSRPKRSVIQPQLLQSYDYVVVGAGTAGCAVASRLSEKDDVKVALLEAGDDDQKYPNSALPMGYFPLQLSETDWQYKSIPQNNSCQGFQDKVSTWPRGKLLGGSGSIHGLMYIRGNRRDFDKWAESGCEGWSYADVLPYFIRAEANENQDFLKNGYHGSHGPVGVSDSTTTPILTKAWLEAGKELGYQYIDVNGKEQIGVSHNQRYVSRGLRTSTATGHLREAMGRPNLHVATKAHVTKILFDGKKAIGVEYHRNGHTQKVLAEKEVILSAGAVNSPQLLMLSGIGPKKHLQDLGISVLSDLPVGDNLQDHLMTDAVMYTVSADGIIPLKQQGLLPSLQYQLFGTGYQATMGSEAVGFVRSKYQPQEDLEPYIQYIFISHLFGNNDDMYDEMRSKFGYDEQSYKALYGNAHNLEGATALVKLLHPLSTGWVRLNSADPWDKPVIHPNYLAHQQDVDVFVDGIRIAQKFFKTQSFKKVNATDRAKVLPGCVQHTYDSDMYWECYVRHITMTVYHPVGTCKMGSSNDPTAVVDSKLRVKGVSGLRVVDASIMPDIVSGNTNAATIVIGEKAAEMIKRELFLMKYKTNEKVKGKSKHTEL